MPLWTKQTLQFATEQQTGILLCHYKQKDIMLAIENYIKGASHKEPKGNNCYALE